MLTDPIADMFTRIRNAHLARKEELVLPFSKIKFSIGELLEREKFIKKIEKIKDRHDQIKIWLRYDNGEPGIQSIKRVSKPGRRVYMKNKELPRVLSGQGILIISTPQGVMTDQEARKEHLGGEIICEVY